jgi:hypothetical protein
MSKPMILQGGKVVVSDEEKQVVIQPHHACMSYSCIQAKEKLCKFAT